MIPVYQEWALCNHLYQSGHLTSAAFAHAVGHFAWAGERAQTLSGRFTASSSFWHNMGVLLKLRIQGHESREGEQTANPQRKRSGFNLCLGDLHTIRLGPACVCFRIALP